MPVLDALRGPIWQRLVRKLYLLALASFAVSIATPILITWLTAPAFPPELESLRATLDDVDARDKELARIERDHHFELAVYDSSGSLVAATTGADAPPTISEPPHDLRPGPRGGGLGPGRGARFIVPMTSPAGHVYSFAIEPQGPPEIMSRLVVSLVVVLVLLLLATVFLAATLAVPLAELARATSAFGAGDIAARADMSRAGAFASLATTFNQMAERVTQSMRAERELLANVSHELRTPLARIRVALDIAEAKNVPLEKKSLDGIGRDLKELESLVGDVLTAAQLEASVASPVPVLRPQPMRATTLVESSAERFRAMYPTHRLDVRITNDGTVALDPVLARRALDNLVDNAGKYAEPGSRVTMSAGIEGERLVIAVEDQGIGISAEDQQRLFTPFFRGEKSRDRKTGGVGLGLALVRRIAHAHGGDVSVSSEAGRGTTVTLWFPVTS